MIVLDTNVLSELMRQKPDVTVQRWFASLVINECMITVVTAAELRYGAERLPSGRRQEQLKRAINGIIEEDFSGRVLPYTVAATVLLADLTLVRSASGGQSVSQTPRLRQSASYMAPPWQRATRETSKTAVSN